MADILRGPCRVMHRSAAHVRFSENKDKSIIETETKKSYKELFHVVQDKKSVEGYCKNVTNFRFPYRARTTRLSELL